MKDINVILASLIAEKKLEESAAQSAVRNRYLNTACCCLAKAKRQESSRKRKEERKQEEYKRKREDKKKKNKKSKAASCLRNRLHAKISVIIWCSFFSSSWFCFWLYTLAFGTLLQHVLLRAAKRKREVKLWWYEHTLTSIVMETYERAAPSLFKW